MESKRGQTNSIGGIIAAILAIFVLAIIIITIINSDQGFGRGLEIAFDGVSEFFINVLGPFFNLLLGIEGQSANNAFLIILTFILVSIIVVGTLDSVNLFGDEGQGGIINLAIGIIVAIIGVRFMPGDLWASLTAPSTAFVATLLVGAPFLALFFVTMKLKREFMFGAKLLWLFYLIFMSYLIFGFYGEGMTGFKWVYLIFLVLGAVMLFFDSTVRKFYYREMKKAELSKSLSDMGIKQRAKLRRDLEEWETIRSDMNATNAERKAAEKKINDIKKIYGDISSQTV